MTPSQVTVNFEFQKLPQAWSVATSFAASDNFVDRCQSYSGTWLHVLDALFAAGDFRIRRFRIGERPAVLAVRGQWMFSDEQAIADIQRTVSVVRDFWHDDNFPYFLVTLKPYDRAPAAVTVRPLPMHSGCTCRVRIPFSCHN